MATKTHLAFPAQVPSPHNILLILFIIHQLPKVSNFTQTFKVPSLSFHFAIIFFWLLMKEKINSYLVLIVYRLWPIYLTSIFGTLKEDQGQFKLPYVFCLHQRILSNYSYLHTYLNKYGAFGLGQLFF